MTDFKEFSRRSTLATLSEIVDGEKNFKDKHGINIADEDEWKQLGEFVKRIEERLNQRKPGNE